MRNIISSNPNFTIVLPVSCNASCCFCSWVKSEQNKKQPNMTVREYLKNLDNVLKNLPKDFEQITISGGEPSNLWYLNDVLNIIMRYKNKNIKKVVFTTNGDNLLKIHEECWFKTCVDFVNISRHHYYQKNNNEIFNTKTISWSIIKKISKKLGDYNIPVNINCVLSSKNGIEYDNNFIKKFIKKSKENNINSLTFRKDYDDGFGIHYLEKNLKNPKYISECPVCRKTKYLIDGMDIYFTTSEFEPKDTVGKDIYELILQPDGSLTSDWAGNDILNIESFRDKNNHGKDYMFLSCGFSSC